MQSFNHGAHCHAAHYYVFDLGAPSIRRVYCDIPMLSKPGLRNISSFKSYGLGCITEGKAYKVLSFDLG
jgi:hypothetical protein